MGELPELLDPGRHRDTSARLELAARRLLFALLTVVAVAALLGVLGQEPSGSTAVGDAAELEVSAPARVRGGLFFQGRFTVEARRGLENATLVLDEGWLENMHVNTIEPAPVEEASRDGRLALSFGPLPAGDRLVVYLQFQVNPTNVGRRSADVGLYDGETLLARAERTVTVFP
ncbi:MAG TPA: hypothetical protein VD704_08210 [Gaiellaceae bacterium]|nr:hypothetical protein [Gaiellaceae bacterium]